MAIDTDVQGAWKRAFDPTPKGEGSERPPSAFGLARANWRDRADRLLPKENPPGAGAADGFLGLETLFGKGLSGLL